MRACLFMWSEDPESTFYFSLSSHRTGNYSLLPWTLHKMDLKNLKLLLLSTTFLFFFFFYRSGIQQSPNVHSVSHHLFPKHKGEGTKDATRQLGAACSRERRVANCSLDRGGKKNQFLNHLFTHKTCLTIWCREREKKYTKQSQSV